MKQKIYISGPMSGLENNNFPAFFEAEKQLKKQKYKTINPARLNNNKNNTWVNYLRRDIKAMMDCDSIYMLRGWSLSRGACIEHELATNLGFKIIFDNKAEKS